MQSFIALYSFLDLLLRASLLATQTSVVGGVAFLTLVLLPFGAELGRDDEPIARRCLRILFGAAWRRLYSRLSRAAC